MTTTGGFGRIGFIAVVVVFTVGFLTFTLFQKQVLEHEQYAKAAVDQSTSTSSVQSLRGKIFAKDKDGTLFPLAVSEWTYDLMISPRQVKNKDHLLDELAKDIPGLDKATVMAQVNNDSIYVPPVIKGIEGDVADRVSAKGYAGVFMIPQMTRIYPEADSLAAQIVGFIGADKNGKYGIEAFYNDELKGVSGSQVSKQDSLGRLIDILGQKQSEPGSDLVLTIDHNLQFIVETKLKEALSKYQADSGSIIVMNPKDGSILAVAGQPTYDPNKFFEIKGDDQIKFLSSAASDSYEPGSVFKPITMSAAIDLGLVTPDTQNVFSGAVQVLDKTIHNSQDKVYGKENMTQVLENSDNVAMVWVSGLIGKDKLREYFDKYGFGKKSGIDIIGEQAGILPPKSDWNDLKRANAAFGQGVSVSVIQLATAYSVIANGGTLVTPHIAEKTQNNDQVKSLKFDSRGQVISADTATKIRQMLVGVVELGHGKKAKVDGMKVGGKTGTAQIPDPQGGYYEDRHIGSFAGMFPADDPKYVMVVRLNNPKAVSFAESSAAPTFGEIATWMADYYALR